MRVLVVTHAPRGSRIGNRVTAERWARALRALGHRARVTGLHARGPADLVVALHARRTATAVARSKADAPARPVVVALTGTDLYGDLPRGDRRARAAVAAADRLVVLQPEALGALPRALRRKAHVIRQGVEPGPRRARRRRDGVRGLVVGHLRAVKDPLLVARAVRLLPAASRVGIVHVGGAVTPAFAARARAAAARTPRWRWVGERSRAATRRRLAAADVLVLPSRAEGGANVLGEAVAAGVPVLATRIAGSVGVLGPRWPGFFPVGDARALAAALRRFETEPAFRARLVGATRALAPAFRPARERAAWRALLAGLGARGAAGARPRRQRGDSA